MSDDTRGDPTSNSDHVQWLRTAADEMRSEGHDGWPNVCDWAADEIERLRREKEPEALDR